MSTVASIGLGILTFLGLRTIYFDVAQSLAKDPFERLRSEANTGIDNNIGVRLDNVLIHAYRDGKLVTSANADRVDVSKDRQEFILTGIHDGVFRQSDRSYKYDAQEGIWRSNSRIFSITGSARVYNPDMDLRTSFVEFNERMHTLRTLHPISGRLYHGTLVAQQFHMDTQTENYETGPVDYRGTLAMSDSKDQQDTGPESKLWHFTGDKSKGVRATKDSPAAQYYVDGVASDDEMILKADLVCRYTDRDVAVATGNVKYYSAKADITADKATIFRKEKRVVLVGHVTIYVKPKSEEGKPPKVETVPTFQRVSPDQVTADTPGAAGVGSSAKTLTSTPPKSDPNSLPLTSGGAGAGQTSSATPVGQSTPPAASGKTVPPKGLDTQKTPGAVKNKPQTPEDKKLDEELRNGKTVRKYPMVILCDQVEYWYRKGDRHGHITGNPQGRQDLPQARWRYVWSDLANYDAEKDELTLISNLAKSDVRMKNSKGDDLTAREMTVSTAEDADEGEYSGQKVEAVGWVDEDEDTSPDKKKSSGTTPTPRTGSGTNTGH